jgi:hypothetical protein
MRTKVLSSALCALLVASAILMSGCGERGVACIGGRTLNLQKDADGRVRVAWINARESDGGFVVSGVLRRMDQLGAPIKAHVNVVVVSPEGEVLDKARSSDIYVPRRIASKVQSFERFEVRFADVPPDGSFVRVVAECGDACGAI